MQGVNLLLNLPGKDRNSNRCYGFCMGNMDSLQDSKQVKCLQNLQLSVIQKNHLAGFLQASGGKNRCIAKTFKSKLVVNNQGQSSFKGKQAQ